MKTEVWYSAELDAIIFNHPSMFEWGWHDIAAVILKHGSNVDIVNFYDWIVLGEL